MTKAEAMRAYLDMLSERTKLDGELRASKRRERTAMNAIYWALGVIGDYAPRPDGAGPYWWRMELMRRAGISVQELNKKARKGE